MRERERLEDFRGGHVACRGCKRLLFFAPGATGPPQLCCGIAYVPTQHQIDLLIYDHLQPNEVEGAVAFPLPPPLAIPPGDPEEGDGLPAQEPFGDPDAETEVGDLVVTPEQALERRAARVAELKRRGRIDYG